MKTDIEITQLSSNNSNLKHGRTLNTTDDFFSDLMTLYVVPDKDWYKDINGFEM